MIEKAIWSGLAATGMEALASLLTVCVVINWFDLDASVTEAQAVQVSICLMVNLSVPLLRMFRPSYPSPLV